MNPKFVAFAVLALFAVLHLGSSLKCYSCEGEAACKSPLKIYCNQTNANATQRYLSDNYNGVSLNVNTSSFACFKNRVANKSEVFTIYKGCQYSTVASCSVTPQNETFLSALQVGCTKCEEDLCNSAGNVFASFGAISVSLIVALIGKSII